MAANVVDLPEPVGPVTNTKPRGVSEISRKISGQPRSSNDRILLVRNTAAGPLF